MRSSITCATLALLNVNAFVSPTGKTMRESTIILRAGSKTEESRSRRLVVIETAIGLAVAAATGCARNEAVADGGSQVGRVVSATELLRFSRPPGSSARRIVITGANSGVG